MRTCLLLAFMSVLLFAQNVKIENLRTELYSKTTQGGLKKIEL